MINKELEQYKKSKQASYEALQARCNDLELLNRNLKQECEKLRKDVDPWAYKSKLAIDCASGYKQALDEIEKILRDAHRFNTYCEDDRTQTDVRAFNNERILTVLDIISKAKGEENAG